jgi:sugar porter (SP) family MFS transporter
MATSILLLGAWITSMYGSYPSEQYGRKATLLYNNLLYIAGALMTASGVSALLYVGRLVTGFAVGLTSVVAPVLLSEIASQTTRGTITTLHQLAIVVGILIASLVAYGCVTYLHNGWQYVQAFPVLPATLMMMFSSMIPESPKWLITRKGDIEAAIAVLKRLRSPEENIPEEAEAMRVASQSDSAEEATWGELYAWRKAMIIGCGLMFFQAMTGINSVIFYSTTIFGFAGVSEAILATASVGVVNLFATILAANLVDKHGRKTLILTGSFIMLVALLLLSMVLWFGSDLGATTQGGIAVLGVLVFVFGFAVGLGAACWVIFSEVVPTRLRTKAFGIFMSVNFAFNILIGE